MTGCTGCRSPSSSLANRVFWFAGAELVICTYRSREVIFWFWNLQISKHINYNLVLCFSVLVQVATARQATFRRTYRVLHLSTSCTGHQTDNCDYLPEPAAFLHREQFLVLIKIKCKILSHLNPFVYIISISKPATRKLLPSVHWCRYNNEPPDKSRDLL